MNPDDTPAAAPEQTTQTVTPDEQPPDPGPAVPQPGQSEPSTYAAPADEAALLVEDFDPQPFQADGSQVWRDEA